MCAAIVLTAGSLWGKDDEVIVTRQLTMAQRKTLPDKTITIETKQLIPNKKADASLIDAIAMVMDTIATEDYMNRTFVLLMEPRDDGAVSIAVHSDDIVTKGRQDPSVIYGDLQSGRCHFVALVSKDNLSLLEQTFKRHGKLKFVQEFEFVDFKTPYYPTNVIGQWTPDKGLRLITVTINEDPNVGRDSHDRPAHTED